MDTDVLTTEAFLGLEDFAYFWAGIGFQIVCVITVCTAFWVYQKRLLALRQAAGPRSVFREVQLIGFLCVLFTACVVAAMIRM